MFCLNDGDGLYLLVKPNGGRWWHLDYSIGGKRKTLSISVYPDTGLKAARNKADEARKLVAAGTDFRVPLRISLVNERMAKRRARRLFVRSQ